MGAPTCSPDDARTPTNHTNERTDMATISPLLQRSSEVRAVRGQGLYLFDEDERRYLDFTAGIGVVSTGHCHPRVVEAIQRQAAQLIHGQYTTVLHPRLAELTARLGGLTPTGLDSFFYASAGTEAIEAALRLCRQATARPNIVVFHGSFHGRTMGSLSLTTSRIGLRAGLQPVMGGVVVSPFPDAFRYGWDVDATVRFCLRELDFVFETLSAPRETAAMFLESVLGEGGYVPVPPAFAQGLRERCDRHGILLVIDEIQTGIGRTGRFWGHQHLGVAPDVLVTAKGLASGLPLSAIATSADLMSQGWPGSQGGTYGGNAVACAAALATLDVVEEEGLVERAAELGPYLSDGLRRLAVDHPAIADVRGLGLMIGTVFTATDGEPAPDVARRVQVEAERAGLLLLTCGTYGNVVRWVPPLIVTSEQIDEALEMFSLALTKADIR